jgi:hypothetical protein
MKRRLAVLACALALSALTAHAVAAKLPKCASVKCRDLGCPSDVLCVSGSKVISCADVCNGH